MESIKLAWVDTECSTELHLQANRIMVTQPTPIPRVRKKITDWSQAQVWLKLKYHNPRRPVILGLDKPQFYF